MSFTPRYEDMNLIERLELRAFQEYPKRIDHDEPPSVSWEELREMSLLMKEAAAALRKAEGPS